MRGQLRHREKPVNRRGLLPALALLLPGCGTDINFGNRGTLALGELQVMATDPRLTREVLRRLEALNTGGSGLTVLHLAETTGRKITSRTKEGAAAKIRLSYALTYKLELSGQRQPQNGAFRLNQIIDNDSAAHLASRKEEDRFFAVARIDSINNLIHELTLLFQP